MTILIIQLQFLASFEAIFSYLNEINELPLIACGKKKKYFVDMCNARISQSSHLKRKIFSKLEFVLSTHFIRLNFFGVNSVSLFLFL